MLQRVIGYVERQSFGVCTYLADRLDISVGKLRLFFIYSSFLAVGFPIVFYLLAGIVLDIRRYVRFRRKSSIWEL
ncbi:MAG TPA: PspC family transcriptional regulator [Anseongella sp.]|nr:PspC family transcriptional regulator [Anseongella sp.]